MSNKLNSITDSDTQILYQIRIQGHLDQQWCGWFGDLAIKPVDNGDTILTGPLDQPALYGLLRRVRDLGLPLISVNRIEEHKNEYSE